MKPFIQWLIEDEAHRYVAQDRLARSISEYLEQAFAELKSQPSTKVGWGEAPTKEALDFLGERP